MKKVILNILFFLLCLVLGGVVYYYFPFWLSVIINSLFFFIFWALYKVNFIIKNFFKSTKTSNFFLSRILLPLVLSWFATYLYGYIIPANDYKILDNQKEILEIMDKQSADLTEVKLELEKSQQTSAKREEEILMLIKDLSQQLSKNDEIKEESVTDLKKKIFKYQKESPLLEDRNKSFDTELTINFSSIKDITLILESNKFKLKNNKSRAALLYIRSILYTNRGKIDFALKDIKEAILFDNKNPQYWNDLGYLLALLGKDSEAEKQFEKSLQLQNDSEKNSFYFETRNRLATSKFKQGNIFGARKIFEDDLEYISRSNLENTYINAHMLANLGAFQANTENNILQAKKNLLKARKIFKENKVVDIVSIRNDINLMTLLDKKSDSKTQKNIIEEYEKLDSSILENLGLDYLMNLEIGNYWHENAIFDKAIYYNKLSLAQANKLIISSKDNIVRKEIIQKNKIPVLLNLINLLSNKNDLSILNYLEEVVNLIGKHDSTNYIKLYESFYGVAYYAYHNNYDDIILENITQAENYAIKSFGVKNEKTARVYLLKGKYFERINDTQNALENYIKSLKGYSKNNKKYTGIAYMLIGNMYYEEKDWVNAKKNYEASLPLMKFDFKHGKHNSKLTKTRLKNIESKF